MSKTRTNGALQTQSASIVSGNESIRFAGDVAWDIETGPLRAGQDEGSLLSAESARVAAIGYYDCMRDRYLIAYDKDEAAMLRQFWDVFLAANGSGARMVGFNTSGFDVPFILKRSWFHGITVPKCVNPATSRYGSDTFVDLMVVWRCGAYKEFISLDSLAKFLGAGAKNGNGEHFWRLWDKDRKAAIEYLVNDVRITHGCAVRMGIVSPTAA